MKNLILTATVALLVFSAPAFAGSPGAKASSDANASAKSGAVAGAAAISAPTGNGIGAAQSNPSISSEYRAAASQAFAPPLVATPDTCMGSTSVGAQGMSFGLSMGTTWTDHNCERLKNSREIRQAGYGKAADALLCMNDEVRDAMKIAGTSCPQDVSKTAQSAPAATHASVEIAPATATATARPVDYSFGSEYNPAAGRFR